MLSHYSGLHTRSCAPSRPLARKPCHSTLHRTHRCLCLQDIGEDTGWLGAHRPWCWLFLTQSPAGDFSMRLSTALERAGNTKRSSTSIRFRDYPRDCAGGLLWKTSKMEIATTRRNWSGCDGVLTHKPEDERSVESAASSTLLVLVCIAFQISSANRASTKSFSHGRSRA